MNRRRVAIVGAGPTGLFLAVALARRNDRVVLSTGMVGRLPTGRGGVRV